MTRTLIYAIGCTAAFLAGRSSLPPAGSSTFNAVAGAKLQTLDISACKTWDDLQPPIESIAKQAAAEALLPLLDELEQIDTNRAQLDHAAAQAVLHRFGQQLQEGRR